MSESYNMQNTWTSFLGDEEPSFDGYMYTQSPGPILDQFVGIDETDHLLNNSPIQPSGSSFDSQFYDYSSSPGSSSVPSPDNEMSSLTNLHHTLIEPSPSNFKNFTSSLSSPPMAHALSEISHISPKYHCSVPDCRKRSGFTNWRSRLVHARKAHKNLFFCSCPECPWMYTYNSFPTMEALDEHWRALHPNVNHFRCSECSYTTDNVTNIQLKHLHVHFKKAEDISGAMVRIRREKEDRRRKRRGVASNRV